jgi:hypothetical protein
LLLLAAGLGLLYFELRPELDNAGLTMAAGVLIGSAIVLEAVGHWKDGDDD